MAPTLAEQILQAQDLRTEAVEVPEWGVTVYITTMKAKELDAFQNSLLTMKGNTQTVSLNNMRSRFLVRCLVDEKGEHIFTDEQAKELSEKSGGVVQRLFMIAQKINGLDDSEVGITLKN